MLEFYSIFLLVSFFLFVGLKLNAFKNKKSTVPTIELTQVTVIIPFRNEANNLPYLLNSLAQQEHLPVSFLFVDDHSDDKSVGIINDFIEEFKCGQLLTLPCDKTGKKEAINFGVEQASTPFNLTLDADVTLHKNYMSYLHTLPAQGLSSLPVTMKGDSFLGNLFSAEYTFFNAFNYLLSSVRIISISGANLMFNKTNFDYQKQLQQHKQLASGDDYFLLKYFRRNSLPIHINTTYQLNVETKAPSSLINYFDQRVRWLGKSKVHIEWKDTLIGVFILIYFLGGFVALLTALFLSKWLFLICLFVGRLLIDTLIFLNYSQAIRNTKNVFLLPLFQLIYPLLFSAVVVLSLFYKPSWKGRK